MASKQHLTIAKVFNTYELLEQTLILVDNQATVLLAQGVNKTFQHVITSSPSLQRKLFFKPATVAQYLAVQTSFRWENDHATMTSSGYAVNPSFVDRYSRAEPRQFIEIVDGGECGQIIELGGHRYGVHLTTPTQFSKHRDVQESWKKMLLVHYRKGVELLDAFPRQCDEEWNEEEEVGWDEYGEFGMEQTVEVGKKDTMGKLWVEWDQAFKDRAAEKEGGRGDE